jgi:hypothetical protein
MPGFMVRAIALGVALSLSLAGCSNPASVSNDAYRSAGGRAAGLPLVAAPTDKAVPTGATFTVAPSGDSSGQADWQNIMDAFAAAVAAGPGSTVRLGPGDFYINRPIGVKNFSGTFKGAGRGETRIHNPPQPGFVFPLLRSDTMKMLDGFPTTMAFWQEGGLVANPRRSFSDFSLYIDCVTEDWNSHGIQGRNYRNFIDNFGDFTGVGDFAVSRLDLTFERVDLIGERNPEKYHDGGYSALNTIQVCGELVGENDLQGTLIFKYAKPASGTFIISDCSISHASVGVDFAELRNSRVVVGGGPNAIFRAEDIGMPAVILEGFSASVAEISYLETLDCSGILVFQADTAVYGIDMDPVPELMPEPSDYIFSHLDVSMPADSYWAGLELYDFADIPLEWGGAGKDTVEVAIADSVIRSPGNNYPPVFGQFLDGVALTGNRILGQGDVAVAIDLAGSIGKHWRLVGNTMAGFTAFWGAPVYLGPGTSLCEVIGSGSGSVIDDGTGNIVTGMGNLGHRGLGGLLDMAQIRARMKARWR